MASKRTLVATLLTALAATALSGCGTGEASVATTEEIQTATPVPVSIAVPTRSDIFATYEATATIASDADAPAVAKVGGDVIMLFVEEGDRVEQGDVLAQLDGNLDRVRSEYDRYTDLAARGLVSEAMFEGLRYDLEALEASYELARLNYDYSKIRAPISGIVSTREVKLGQNIAANDVVFRITDTSSLVAYLQIPQAETAKFSAGHSATVVVDAMPDTIYGAEIARISPTIDVRNGTFRATAFVDNRTGELAPGMFARFSISYERHADALVIPKHALVEEDDQAAVYVVENGAVSRRIIETGIEANEVVEVLGGLSGDEEIVVIGHSGLRDGSKVLASNKLQDSYSG
jgi:membrane fusion protein (multidrug efflux system)